MKKGKKGIGNPLLVAQMAKKITSGPNTGKIIAGTLAAIGLGVGFFYVKRKVADAKAQKEGERVGVDAEATAASAITQAINPSGMSWLKKVDGTNAPRIMKSIENAIRDGKTYKQISDSYKILTKGGNLQEDMKSDLSDPQYETFLNVVRLNSSGGKASSSNFKNPVENGQVLASTGKLTVRKTPYINGNLTAFKPRGNAIEYIPGAKIFIGVATGKYKTSTSRDGITDDKASVATVFYEVAVAGNDKKPHRVWVAAQLIKVYPKGTRPSTFNKAYMMDMKEYDKAQAVNESSLNGVNNNMAKLLM